MPFIPAIIVLGQATASLAVRRSEAGWEDGGTVMLRSTRVWLSTAAGKLFPTPVTRYWAVTAWLLILGTPALATAPPAPPNRVKTTTNFSHTTPIPISPAGTFTTTSTLVVSGVGAYLWDLDLTTVIEHTGRARPRFNLDVT